MIDGPPALRGLSFSEADVRTAAMADVSELRAITAGWLYTMRPPPGGWSFNWWQRALEPARRAAYAEALNDLRPRVLRGELTRDEMAALLMHETWRRVAASLGMHYSRRQVKP